MWVIEQIVHSHMCLSHCILHRRAQTDGAPLTVSNIPTLLNVFAHVNVNWLISDVLILFDVYIRSTVSLWQPVKKEMKKSIIKDLFWVLLQLKSVGYFLPWNTFWEVVLWSSLCFVHSNIPEGTVCVLRVGRFLFFLVKLHILTTAHSDSTVSEEFLSILLCAHGELFPLGFQGKSRVGKGLTYRCPLMTSCTPVGVFLQRARQAHTEVLGLEQWHATPQDVYVISRVCQKLFGVAVETKCNIEPPFHFSLWLLWL